MKSVPEKHQPSPPSAPDAVLHRVDLRLSVVHDHHGRREALAHVLRELVQHQRHALLGLATVDQPGDRDGLVVLVDDHERGQAELVLVRAEGPVEEDCPVLQGAKWIRQAVSVAVGANQKRRKHHALVSE